VFLPLLSQTACHQTDTDKIMTGYVIIKKVGDKVAVYVLPIVTKRHIIINLIVKRYYFMGFISLCKKHYGINEAGSCGCRIH
jgi:hypothetical protein